MIGVKVFVQVLLISFVKNAAGKDFYSYAVKDHEGEDFSLETYRGKVTLVVNVASHCGYTEATYRALKKLHDILSYGDHFSVLAFPCNQFGEQEPLDMPEIINFVTSEYNVEFPIFNKINVIGEDAEPAFRQLTVEEVKMTLKEMKNGHASGPVQITINGSVMRRDEEQLITKAVYGELTGRKPVRSPKKRGQGLQPKVTKSKAQKPCIASAAASGYNQCQLKYLKRSKFKFSIQTAKSFKR
ncbi:probable glutathione peroxidase 8 [Macrobrachium nipponense]|uniref:probable glutathione peroxidase 8 n=1 Tax=Macrobrachium nipponense TaxID=159736 RepID=UPI0030C8843B